MRYLFLLLAIALPTWAQNQSCVMAQRLPITITASGTTIIAPSQGGGRVHICQVSFAGSTAVDVKFQSVTSGGVATDLTGAYKGVTALAFDFQGSLRGGYGESIALNLSATATAGGFVSFYFGAAQ